MKFNTTNSLYLFIGLSLSLLLSSWAGLKGFTDGDTEVYLLFYESLISDGLLDIQSCQSFEPLFCGVSYLAGEIFSSGYIVQYFWTFLYFATTFKAFLIFYKFIFPNESLNFKSFIYFTFISINYVDPQIVFFLTRQYVASAFLMLGFAKVATNRSPTISFAIAILIHFGALPIALTSFLFSKRIQIKRNNLIVCLLIGFLLVYFSDLYFIDVYFESLKYKAEDYSDRSDGDITIMQEIKLLAYWALTVWLYKNNKIKLALSAIIVYIFYLSTSISELIHLRYYKYLESMSWPGIFMIIYFFKKKSPFIISSLLLFRIYKYLTLISAESSIFYMIIFLINSFIYKIISFIH